MSETVNTNHGCDTTRLQMLVHGNVFANSIGVVRKGDENTKSFKRHNDNTPCTTHSVAMSSNMSKMYLLMVKMRKFGRSGYVERSNNYGF